MITAYPGNSFLVETISINDIQRFGKDIVLRTLHTGGFYCTAIPVGVIELCPKEILEKATPSELKTLELMEGSTVIQHVKEFSSNMSEEDIRAILFHEEGHIVLGHTSKEHQAHCEVVNGILIDVQSEIEADRYAASKVGKKTVAKALTHLIENMCHLDATRLNTRPLDTKRYQENLSELLMSPLMRPRFEALA